MSITQALNYSSSVYIYATHEDYVELMPTWGYAVSAFVLFLIGFFGFFLNLMVIVLMFKDKQLWTPLNVILFNLVCSDFSVSVLGNPFTLISALSHRWIFGKTMCVLYGFFMTLLGITSITTLTVLSFERYMMVSRPLVSRHLSMRGASLSIFFIWSYSFLVTSPPLFGWGNYINEAANISCSINWEEQTFNTLTYILFLFGFGLVLPVVIITFSYMSIIRTMKKNAIRMGRVTKAESRVTMMVLIMIITFMVAWTPYAILALIEQFAPHDMVSPGLGVVPALVAKSSICYDPIIYVGMNTQFRSSVKQIFGFGEKENSMHERGMENTLMSPTKPVSHYNDNNIKLQYLNPNNNTVVAVTIYQDDEYDGRSSDDSQMDKKKKNKLDKTKKKITLTGKTILDESTELSAEFYAREGNAIPHVCSNKHSKNILTPQQAPDAKTVKELTYKMYDENSADNNSSPPDSDTNIIATTKPSNKTARTRNQLHDFAGKISDNSSSGQIDDFNSDDMLIGTENNESCGATNKAMSFWDESSTNDPKQIHHSFKPETYFKQHESPTPLRRKSLASTQLKYKPDSDMKRIKSGSVRRKSSSSGILAGHTRKLSAALHDTRGNIVTRLMVDERERSKLMCFEEQKANYQENKGLQGEQMM